jgi:hypothetical protein
MEAYVGKQFLGIDLHRRRTVIISEPAPQRADRDRGNPNGRGELGVSNTVGGHQQHPGPFHLTMCRCRRPGQHRSTPRADRQT